jgi:glucose-1-phosphatase
MAVEFVYFDVGGVLIDWSDVFKTAAHKFNLSVDDIDMVFSEHHDLITKGLMSSAQFWEKCIEKYHIINAESFDFLASWVADYKPITLTHALIEAISPDFGIGLLSNIYEGMMPFLRENNLIPTIEYRSVVFSCDVGMMKPEQAIYHYAQEQSKTRPEHILFVDDRQDFLELPASMGWKTFLFDEKKPIDTIDEIKHMLA